jgi:hypothetical protein
MGVESPPCVREVAALRILLNPPIEDAPTSGHKRHRWRRKRANMSATINPVRVVM